MGCGWDWRQGSFNAVMKAILVAHHSRSTTLLFRTAGYCGTGSVNGKRYRKSLGQSASQFSPVGRFYKLRDPDADCAPQDKQEESRPVGGYSIFSRGTHAASWLPWQLISY